MSNISQRKVEMKIPLYRFPIMSYPMCTVKQSLEICAQLANIKNCYPYFIPQFLGYLTSEYYSTKYCQDVSMCSNTSQTFKRFLYSRVVVVQNWWPINNEQYHIAFLYTLRGGFWWTLPSILDGCGPKFIPPVRFLPLQCTPVSSSKYRGAQPLHLTKIP